MRRARPVLALLAAAAALVLLTAGSASAQPTFFNKPDPIAIPTFGSASPYPSSIFVDGLRGPVTDVTVTLHKFSHENPEDVDILLVAPSGRSIVLVSDVCGTDEINRFDWTFSDRGPRTVTDDPGCGEFFHFPTNRDAGPADTWPTAPSGSRGASFGLAFDDDDPNGNWRLFVVDDNSFEGGEIEKGWTLSIDTAPADAVVPDLGTSGNASPYPATRTITGRSGVITDVNVALDAIWHQSPDDLDMLLVGPRGQAVVLMSDACGGLPVVSTRWSWDDEATRSMPDGIGCDFGLGPTTPTNFLPGDDTWPAPAPDEPYSPSLSAFDLTNPNGDWKLFVRDDAVHGTGFFTNRFTLDIETRPEAAVAFADAAVTLDEGTTRDVRITRTASGPLAAGAVTVTTTAVSATAGADFTPIATTVQFTAGEREKTVPVAALSDAVVPEPDETFTLTLAGATGDAVVGTPASVGVAIPGQAAPGGGTAPGGGGSGGGGGGGGGNTPPAPGAARDRTKPIVAVAPGRKLGRDGRLKVRVRCSEACGGRVVLTASKGKRKLGSAPFRIARAGSVTVKVKLSSKGRKTVRSGRRLAVTAVATATDGTANRGVGIAKGTVRR